jgi:hypothetical protein
MPMPARAVFSLFSTLATAGVLLAGCAGDATAPSGALGASRSSAPLVPHTPARALVGAADGTYTFTLDPNDDQVLRIGESALVIPSNSICGLEDSGYGPDTWNTPCRPERARLTITATVRNAQTNHPRIDFEPALRFSPRRSVNLYMHVDNATTFADWGILYCSAGDASSCLNEAASDPSLAARVTGQLVTRRIKHFSGYVVTNFMSNISDLF